MRHMEKESPWVFPTVVQRDSRQEKKGRQDTKDIKVMKKKREEDDGRKKVGAERK